MRWKSTLIVTICFLLLLPVASHAKTTNLSDIITPTRLQVVDYHPVKIDVEFHAGARPETFKAWLNHKNITDVFEPTENGMTAFVGPEDGLIYRVLGEDRRSGRDKNILRTKIIGANRKVDIDVRIFSTRYNEVQTSRDDKGIYYITGGSLADVFEAQGYATAYDRLWQMELYRRQALGKLSEVFGAGFIGTDIYMRTYGYSAAEYLSNFDQLDEIIQNMIQSYVDGINRRIEEIAADDSILPFEFIALGIFPEPWTPTDVLAWTIALQHNFDSEGFSTAQIDNAGLLQGLADTFGSEAPGMFEDLRWINDPDALTYIPAEEAKAMSVSRSMVQPTACKSNLSSVSSVDGSADFNFGPAATAMSDIRNEVIENLKGINAYVKLGSYAWAVSGSKTQSGNPIIYSGPQAGFSVPAIVQEGSIRGGGLNVSGGAVPGIPGILIGRTPHVAWTIQVGHGHTVDNYLENASDVFLHRTETIQVAGGNDIELPVYRTVHGPVVYPMPYNTQDPGDTIVAWKHAAWGINDFFYHQSLLGLARATSMDEFGEALEDLPFSVHFTYADRNGNIAYWMAGPDPIRPAGVDTRLPQLGDGSHEWPEPVTYKPTSTDRNTSQGFYSGWNNKTNSDYDNLPAGSRYRYGPFHRAQVIHDYLSANDNLSFEDLRDLALNIATTDSTVGSGGNPWKFVQDDFTDAVAANATPERTAALELLQTWDGHFIAGGETEWAWADTRADAWVLMDEWIKEALALTFDDELGFASEDKALLFQVLLHGLAGDESGVVNNYNWFQNLLDDTAPQTAEAIIIKALDNVLAALGPQPWERERGTINFNHMFLGEVWNIPFASRSTYGQCIEMGADGPIRIESMFPLGESGTILMGTGGSPEFDEHFFSMADFFDDFSHRSFALFD
jgi:penicillin amidase